MSPLWWNGYFFPWRDLVKAQCRWIMHTRGEGRGWNRQTNIVIFKFFLTCLKIGILFHCFLRSSFHEDHLLGAFPLHPTCSWVKITCFMAVQEWGGSRGGPSPPFPHSSVSLLLWPWWHQDAGLCSFVVETGRLVGPSQPPVKSCRSQCRGAVGMSHVHTHVHWACIQVHTFLERCPGAVVACTTSCDVGIGVGPNILHHRLGRTPRLWFRCDWGQ